MRHHLDAAASEESHVVTRVVASGDCAYDVSLSSHLASLAGRSFFHDEIRPSGMVANWAGDQKLKGRRVRVQDSFARPGDRGRASSGHGEAAAMEASTRS